MKVTRIDSAIDRCPSCLCLAKLKCFFFPVSKIIQKSIHIFFFFLLLLLWQQQGLYRLWNVAKTFKKSQVKQKWKFRSSKVYIRLFHSTSLIRAGSFPLLNINFTRRSVSKHWWNYAMLDFAPTLCASTANSDPRKFFTIKKRFTCHDMAHTVLRDIYTPTQAKVLPSTSSPLYRY